MLEAEHLCMCLRGVHVNVWDVVEDLTGIVSASRPIDPVRLADPEVPLGDLAPERQ